MDWKKEYQEKLTTPEEAVKVVKSGDWVDYGSNQGLPELLDKALAARKDELEDVKIRALIISKPVRCALDDPDHDAFTYNSWHMIGNERKMCDRGQCSFIPMLFRNLPVYYRRYLKVNVAMLSVTPMDENGYFNFSINNCNTRAVADAADVVILEVNEKLPYVHGLQNTIHISEADMVVEGEHAPLVEFPSIEAGDVEKKIAESIVAKLRNGSCIQLGVGGMPDAIGKLIADSDLKDLGIHTELLVNAYLEMAKAGKITNMNKHGLMRGKSVFGIVHGTQELYDWTDHNQSMCICPMDYVNNVNVIKELDNFVSINSCIAVDLYGQVSAESAGTRQISGTGGQLDFLTGAFENPTAQSFIAMPSTFTDKKGTVHTNIRPVFDTGDIVTDPRSQAMTIVTEYGMADLVGCTTWERSEKLIDIAHPDFREELISSAEKMGIWRRSNKR
jgi:butyryl-CoA:acetate CoA-transferase